MPAHPAGWEMISSDKCIHQEVKLSSRECPLCTGVTDGSNLNVSVMKGGCCIKHEELAACASDNLCRVGSLERQV